MNVKAITPLAGAKVKSVSKTVLIFRLELRVKDMAIIRVGLDTSNMTMLI